MIATAKLKYLGVSAQKTRLVVDLVRGKPVGEALATLRYSRKMVAKDLVKLLQSAVANAQQKDAKLDVDGLIVAHATVDEGPPQKRARARSMGRIYRILKKSSHVSFGLDLVRPKLAPPVRTEAKPAASATPKKAARKAPAKKAAPKRAAAKR
jgi:large subunit ribosomal protein L22